MVLTFEETKQIELLKHSNKLAILKQEDKNAEKQHERTMIEIMQTGAFSEEGENHEIDRDCNRDTGKDE